MKKRKARRPPFTAVIWSRVVQRRFEVAVATLEQAVRDLRMALDEMAAERAARTKRRPRMTPGPNGQPAEGGV